MHYQKIFHPNRPKGSGEKQRKTEKVGLFWLFFEDSAVPEGRMLMRTKNLDSPANFTLENIYPTVLSKWSHNRKRCFTVTKSQIGTLSDLLFHAGSNKTGPKLIRPTVLAI